MIQHFFTYFYREKKQWWVPVLSGLPFALTQPPFNHELHWIFSGFPFLSFIAIAPLLFFSLQQPRGRAVLHTYLFAYAISVGQVFWVAFVKIEGLWALIILGMFLLAGYVALFYLAAGMVFRVIYRIFPKHLVLFLFPAVWVLIEYGRTFSDLAFPWGLLGYNLTPVLPLSQFASITGVWGLTYTIVFANELVFSAIKEKRCGRKITNAWQFPAFILFLSAISLWGFIRIRNIRTQRTEKIALVQPNLDQLNWGNYSLEESFAVFDSIIYSIAPEKPDLIICPESSLLCYLSRQNTYRRRFQQWADSTNTPIILGALHWDRPQGNSIYDYLVYNTAFLARPGKKIPELYRKIKLVPFSEIFPFEANIPILSRVNLGEADFKRGKEEKIFVIDSTVSTAPYVCYEIIFPDFVRRRLHKNVNLITHITNDGWFGKTSGPYQHAMMTRMRAIENSVPIARCAITGVSMFIDPAGRVISKTSLDERSVLIEKLGLKEADTFYNRHGDWFIILCANIFLLSIITAQVAAILKKKHSRT